MFVQTTSSSISSPPLLKHKVFGCLSCRPYNLSLQVITQNCKPQWTNSHAGSRPVIVARISHQQADNQGKPNTGSLTSGISQNNLWNLSSVDDDSKMKRPLTLVSMSLSGQASWLVSAQMAQARENIRIDPVYEIGELFELGIQLSYLLVLLGLLGAGTFFVIRQVLVRRELDLSAKELQEQVRSGDANATELFELGAVMLRRKFYPAATKYLLQAIEKWDGDTQDLAQVHNALGVSYVRDDKVDKGIAQLETAVKLQPGYVTAWNNLGDAYDKKNEYTLALKAFEEALLFDPNNPVARPRRDALKDRVKMLKGVPVKMKSKDRGLS
ncbi:hypothetical protein ACFE04_007633 [Oxalis oulophora]